MAGPWRMSPSEGWRWILTPQTNLDRVFPFPAPIGFCAHLKLESALVSMSGTSPRTKSVLCASFAMSRLQKLLSSRLSRFLALELLTGGECSSPVCNNPFTIHMAKKPKNNKWSTHTQKKKKNKRWTWQGPLLCPSWGSAHLNTVGGRRRSGSRRLSSETTPEERSANKSHCWKAVMRSTCSVCTGERCRNIFWMEGKWAPLGAGWEQEFTSSWGPNMSDWLFKTKSIHTLTRA